MRAQRRGVGVRRAPEIPGVPALHAGAKPGLGDQHAEFRPDRPRRNLPAGLESEVGGGPVAVLLPGRARQDGIGLGLQRRAREFLEHRIGVVLGPRVERGRFADALPRLDEAELGPAEEEALEDRLGPGLGDQLVEALPELDARGSRGGAADQELEGDPLLVGLAPGGEELEELVPADARTGAGDEAQEEPEMVRLRALARRASPEGRLGARRSPGRGGRARSGRSRIPG